MDMFLRVLGIVRYEEIPEREAYITNLAQNANLLGYMNNVAFSTYVSVLNGFFERCRGTAWLSNAEITIEYLDLLETDPIIRTVKFTYIPEEDDVVITCENDGKKPNQFIELIAAQKYYRIIPKISNASASSMQAMPFSSIEPTTDIIEA